MYTYPIKNKPVPLYCLLGYQFTIITEIKSEFTVYDYQNQFFFSDGICGHSYVSSIFSEIIVF